MKRSKDLFESAIEEEPEESLPESAVDGGGGSDDGRGEIDKQAPEPEEDVCVHRQSKKQRVAEAKNKDATSVAHSMKMQTILSQFTEEQMSRYERFRRSALPKGNMKKLLEIITGSKNVDDNVNLVVCGITKMFVGELVETARLVMGKRKDSGPIRPCHIRESYRKLKLQGKVPQRSVTRLFR